MSEQEASLDEFVSNADEQKLDQHLPEIDKIPKDWSIVAVEDVADNLVGGGTPSKSNDEYWEGDIPWASVKDLNGIELSETEDHITEAGVKNSATNVVSTDSVIVSTRMTVGEPFLNNVDMAINQDMKAIIPDTERINPLFLVYSLWDKDPYLKSLGRGTTVDGITTQDLLLTHFGLPSIEEQHKIASVLYTVDQAIQKTEEISVQTKRTKRGVAQNLFRHSTNGQETVDTWLGKVPATWEIVPFKELIDSNRNGLYKSTDAYGEGYPIAKMGNALEERVLNMSTADRLELTKSEKEKYALEEGDLIFARRAQDVSAAGDCCYVPKLDELTVFESSLIRIRLTGQADPRFYTQYFEGPIGSKAIERIITETSISGIATSDLLELKTALPPLEEQREIASILWEFDRLVEALQDEMARYKQLKQGLMQDLLSGEVRTHDKDIEIVNEVLQHG
ncbi:Restriction endonuclease S subunit [Halalkaliarchaeum sp. AArc-CO]|uniref:restriction endonuclease subunit S n=1 Tax=Halalkaliarchaeum sp. AArc-CO TaxID=2866381 RepID=UPI00217E27B9|nr:restriction endonuclease subunit S [Halalkaliarchaeum sp. AArc-CO]UWG50712.1 Restriction endonuclease S subunit [Halalkaliarchaeum sp. AArc-CO]